MLVDRKPYTEWLRLQRDAAGAGGGRDRDGLKQTG